MKRPLLAALLSAFVLPGLGQVYTRRLKAGLGLILGSSALLVTLVIVLVLKLSRAAAELADKAPAQAMTLRNLADQVRAQDQTVLLIALALLAGLWVFGVVDAWRGARRPE